MTAARTLAAVVLLLGVAHFAPVTAVAQNAPQGQPEFLPNNGDLYHRIKEVIRASGWRCGTVHTVHFAAGTYVANCSDGSYALTDTGRALRVAPWASGTPGGAPGLLAPIPGEQPLRGEVPPWPEQQRSNR